MNTLNFTICLLIIVIILLQFTQGISSKSQINNSKHNSLNNNNHILNNKPSLLHKVTSYNTTFEERKIKLNPETFENNLTPNISPTSFILIKQSLENDNTGKGKRLFFTILLTVVLLGLILILIKYSLKFAETIRMDVEKIKLKNNFEVLKELSERSVAIKNLLNKNN
jgi:hypothetical protein